jgi:alpha-D-ribose 1-methylphosphonate 5-triphosphate diphosphatase PhnM
MTVEESAAVAVYDHQPQQRPFRIRKSLRELLHKQRSIPNKTCNLQQSQQRYNSLRLPPLPHHNTKCDEYAYDVLYECQRG